MLNYDKLEIGNRLHAFRKKAGLTQAETAEAAGLSDRAYAEIERGLSNMRTETLLNICRVLRITPNDLLLFSVMSVLYHTNIGFHLYCYIDKRAIRAAYLAHH